MMVRVNTYFALKRVFHGTLTRQETGEISHVFVASQQGMKQLLRQEIQLLWLLSSV
jgi:hypothetical protein